MLPPQDHTENCGWDGAETTPSSSSGADSALGGRKQDQWAQCENAPLSPAGPRGLPAPCGPEAERGRLVLGLCWVHLLEHPHPCKWGTDVTFIL